MTFSTPAKSASIDKPSVAGRSTKSAPSRKAAGLVPAKAKRLAASAPMPSAAPRAPAAASPARAVEAPQASNAEVAPKAVKRAKARPRLVRDGFTMPEADFALIAALKSRALGARRHAKKSELLRAGLRALATLDAKALVDALDRLEAVKIGRPRKGH